MCYPFLSSKGAHKWLVRTGLSGGLNLYEFCRNNSVNFLDPMGLFCKDGLSYTRAYVEQLMKERQELERLFFSFEWLTISGWAANKERDIKAFKDSTAKYRIFDQVHGDELGNINAAYAFTWVYGPIAGNAISVLGELVYSRGSFMDVLASFGFNSIGIMYAEYDHWRTLLDPQYTPPWTGACNDKKQMYKK